MVWLLIKKLCLNSVLSAWTEPIRRINKVISNLKIIKCTNYVQSKIFTKTIGGEFNGRCRIFLSSSKSQVDVTEGNADIYKKIIIIILSYSD